MYRLATIPAAMILGLAVAGPTNFDVAWAENPAAESGKVVKEFLATWDARDLDAMMTFYATDASVIMQEQQPFKGTDQIRSLMQNFVDDFSKPGAVWDTYAVTAEGDAVHMLWRAETPETKFPFGANTFFVRGGKIAHHTIAFTAEAK